MGSEMCIRDRLFIQAIKEAYSLIAAGVDEEEANKVLKSLGILSDIVEIIKDKVLVKTFLPSNLPSLDTELHSLAFILLKRKREKIYVLDKENINLALKGVKVLKDPQEYFTIHSSYARLIEYISYILVFFASFYTVHHLYRYPAMLWFLELVAKNIPGVGSLYALPSMDSFLSSVMGVYFVVWWYRILKNYAYSGEKLKINSIIYMAPVLHKFLRWAKGRKEEK
mgnify:CR=1 FL=1